MSPTAPDSSTDLMHRHPRGGVHLSATVIEDGRGLSSMSGVLADTVYLLPA
ncbi:hypothetical protein [Streptomyces sp. NBC_01314]|uniref:hypothetical protein n=1 Tax=Streptomyces sp. NBC_01314 TaxID=2903821 RepID=UPI003088DF43|nr:hypothetical protein OG622_45055 [Streptomyces sp. NBC_01314]